VARLRLVGEYHVFSRGNKEPAMPDSTTTIHDLRERMRDFVAERDWEQFHDLKNLSMAIAVEAAELMEIFRWVDGRAANAIAGTPEGQEAVRHEVADVLLLLLSFANAAGIDLSEAAAEKLAINRNRYPVNESRGRAERRE
jgi:dCTP diphosphatase